MTTLSNLQNKLRFIVNSFSACFTKRFVPAVIQVLSNTYNADDIPILVIPTVASRVTAPDMGICFFRTSIYTRLLLKAPILHPSSSSGISQLTTSSPLALSASRHTHKKPGGSFS
jgi:hypothetical protein